LFLFDIKKNIKKEQNTKRMTGIIFLFFELNISNWFNNYFLFFWFIISSFVILLDNFFNSNLISSNSFLLSQDHLSRLLSKLSKFFTDLSSFSSASFIFLLNSGLFSIHDALSIQS